MSKPTSLAVSLAGIVYLLGLPDRVTKPRCMADRPFLGLGVAYRAQQDHRTGCSFPFAPAGGGGLKALGLSPQNWPKHLAIGLVFGLAMFIAFNVVLSSLMNSFLPRPTASGPSIFIHFKEPRNLLAWLPIGIFGGGVVEELQRIFIFTRFEKWLGRPGLILGIMLSSIMFGFGHWYQGPGTAIATTLSGVVFALLYLRRRSALEPITAHALSDVFAMIGATMQAR